MGRLSPHPGGEGCLQAGVVNNTKWVGALLQVLGYSLVCSVFVARQGLRKNVVWGDLLVSFGKLGFILLFISR